MRYDAAIFDLDGTLWNASKSSTIGWNIGLKKLGIEKSITISDIERVTGKPVDLCVQILFPDEYKQYPRLIETLCRYEEEAIKNYGGTFYDNVINCIKKLSKMYPLFLVSNCQDWYLDVFFLFSHLKDYFKGYNCFGLSRKKKHEMLTELRNQYKFKNPVYIGDTEDDEEAAYIAGYEYIHLTFGFGQAKKAERRFQSFSDLCYFLKSSFVENE
jgi:phosphoglycolate phosphatase